MTTFIENDRLNIAQIKTMKNELIAFAIISCILIAMILITTPLENITLKDFGGVFGVIGFVVVKKLVDAFFQKRDKSK